MLNNSLLLPPKPEIDEGFLQDAEGGGHGERRWGNGGRREYSEKRGCVGIKKSLPFQPVTESPESWRTLKQTDASEPIPA